MNFQLTLDLKCFAIGMYIVGAYADIRSDALKAVIELAFRGKASSYRPIDLLETALCASMDIGMALIMGTDVDAERMADFIRVKSAGYHIASINLGHIHISTSTSSLMLV